MEQLLASDRALALVVAMESALEDDRLEVRCFINSLEMGPGLRAQPEFYARTREDEEVECRQ